MTVGDEFREALTLLNAGRYVEAQKVCVNIKKVRPQSPDVYNILGGIAYKLKKPEEAMTHFRRVIELKPDHHEARLNLGKVLCSLQRWGDAARHYEVLANAMDKDARVLMGYARIQLRLQRYDDAICTYNKALTVHPSTDVVENAIAVVFSQAGRIKEAEEAFAAILARSPGFAPALINLAFVRDIQGRMDDALKLQEDAIHAEPKNPDAHYHHALSLLTRERFIEGWAEYSWRFHQPLSSTLHERFPIPFWEGESLRDKHLLIWTEQGPGDEVLISSMIPDVLARGARVTLICSERLAPLFNRSFPDVDIIHREQFLADQTPPITADYQASFSHLGRQLRQHIGTFPAGTNYLRANQDLTQKLRARYQGKTDEPLIGISWRSANVQAGSEKSTTLAAWSSILRVPNVRFVSLQYGDHQEEISAVKATTGINIATDATVDPLKNMDRFAAQVAAMDLVISISNTTVHVAGAMGRPVWTLVPSSTGRIWYWFLERTHSPWYPSMRLFRQVRGAGWNDTIDKVTQELATYPNS
jgi:Flp pilus assembly protein TadD/ADP-heptose:LPS heptosyltransferase